ncbi:dinuclear metal center protein [Kosmotoga arenicorallina S304]|uniref:Dinuclear metal center protein n=1 Tax=Kosmotoga arenicorallina S304 TaxID=1453497 RepID=A0A176JXF7_9BACT|nr:Nif3-like dinuclear metal center hexameric protein [Kosmotoga arenicorallina]OAA28367.1 dinuclear metal center protein [Kosmotoga arenicorallina S304]
MNAFEIEEYLNGILKPWNFEDFCFNGIQIEGSRNVKRVALGVSFNLAFIEKAIGWSADMLLVHHGIFGKDFFKLRGYLKKRVEKVLENGLTLMGYHLPLDAHPECGNNALIAKALGLEIEEPFDVGYIGGYNTPIETSTFLDRLSKLLNRKDLLSYVNRPTVQKVCVISGGGASDIIKLEGKVDTFITGEVKEHIRDLSREMQINFINAGHYATETFGVKEIGKLLEEKFGLETRFFDIYNEV